jgi:hypothetical protein
VNIQTRLLARLSSRHAGVLMASPSLDPYQARLLSPFVTLAFSLLEHGSRSICCILIAKGKTSLRRHDFEVDEARAIGALALGRWHWGIALLFIVQVIVSCSLAFQV